MNVPDIEALKVLPIIAEILNRLNQELPKSLIYHNPMHTQDVINEALNLASLDGLDLRSLELLAIAAAYHDSGFLTQTLDNERLGAQFAQEAMLRFGTYTPEEVSLVTQAILDTKVNYGEVGPVQTANNVLSGYLLDADLANFGRSDFFEKSRIYMAELNRSDSTRFLEETLHLLERHDWQTEAARSLRQEMKAENIRRLHRQLDSHRG